MALDAIKQAGQPKAAQLIPTRESLLSRLKNWNDNESWKVFFDTYWRLIYSTALRSGLNDKEAEDIVQETVVSVMKSMPNFRYDPAKGSFKGWLSAIARRRIADYLRLISPEKNAVQTFFKAGTETDGGMDWGQFPDSHQSQFEAIWDEEWETNFKQAILERIKRKVELKHYQIFDLHVMREWEAGDVAKALNVSRALVYLTKHRIQKLLQNERMELLSNPLGAKSR